VQLHVAPRRVSPVGGDRQGAVASRLADIEAGATECPLDRQAVERRLDRVDFELDRMEIAGDVAMGRRVAGDAAAAEGHACALADAECRPADGNVDLRVRQQGSGAVLAADAAGPAVAVDRRQVGEPVQPAVDAMPDRAAGDHPGKAAVDVDAQLFVPPARGGISLVRFVQPARVVQRNVRQVRLGPGRTLFADRRLCVREHIMHRCPLLPAGGKCRRGPPLLHRRGVR
jgi:hypothetical protein